MVFFVNNASRRMPPRRVHEEEDSCVALERRQQLVAPNTEEEERVNALLVLGEEADEKPAVRAVAADAGMGRTTAATILKRDSNPWRAL